MPLIVITGTPCSGKTTRALELKTFFEHHGKEVHVVSEYEHIIKANFQKNQFYSDASKEKHIRELLKSEVVRLLAPTNVVILDALNYIKGYRYELYCASKANKSTQCTLHTVINHDESWNFNIGRPKENEKYDRNVFDGLLQRYEPPDGKNRWDSPLFIIFPNEDLNKDAIMSTLFDKAPPLPNMSTQNPSLNSTNFLYDLDQVTKKIVNDLMRSKNMGRSGATSIDGFPNLSVDVSSTTLQQLTILRRQYLTYCKLHPPDPKQIPQLFVQYLNASLH